jgi:hypothetical protein
MVKGERNNIASEFTILKAMFLRIYLYLKRWVSLFCSYVDEYIRNYIIRRLRKKKLKTKSKNSDENNDEYYYYIDESSIKDLNFEKVEEEDEYNNKFTGLSDEDVQINVLNSQFLSSSSAEAILREEYLIAQTVILLLKNQKNNYSQKNLLNRTISLSSTNIELEEEIKLLVYDKELEEILIIERELKNKKVEDLRKKNVEMKIDREKQKQVDDINNNSLWINDWINIQKENFVKEKENDVNDNDSSDIILLSSFSSSLKKKKVEFEGFKYVSLFPKPSLPSFSSLIKVARREIRKEKQDMDKNFEKVLNLESEKEDFLLEKEICSSSNSPSSISSNISNNRLCSPTPFTSSHKYENYDEIESILSFSPTPFQNFQFNLSSQFVSNTDKPDTLTVELSPDEVNAINKNYHFLLEVLMDKEKDPLLQFLPNMIMNKKSNEIKEKEIDNKSNRRRKNKNNVRNANICKDLMGFESIFKEWSEINCQKRYFFILSEISNSKKQLDTLPSQSFNSALPVIEKTIHALNWAMNKEKEIEEKKKEKKVKFEIDLDERKENKNESKKLKTVENESESEFYSVDEDDYEDSYDSNGKLIIHNDKDKKKNKQLKKKKKNYFNKYDEQVESYGNEQDFSKRKNVKFGSLSESTSNLNLTHQSLPSVEKNSLQTNSGTSKRLSSLLDLFLSESFRDKNNISEQLVRFSLFIIINKGFI